MAYLGHSYDDAMKVSVICHIYEILNNTGILDDYIIKCYDVLHTLGEEYLVEDITSFFTERGIKL